MTQDLESLEEQTVPDGSPDETSDRLGIQIGQLLVSLTSVQDELLDVLQKKRQMMADCDSDGMRAMQPREEALNEKLQNIHHQRATLLDRAQQQGISVDSLQSLASELPPTEPSDLEDRLQDVSGKMRLLQHQSLTNWVLAQRSLLHVSQLLEIIATGGRLQPTYGKGAAVPPSGALVDRMG